jgi:ubiquinone/menaquinone biosynthesis C-methylase UbiE
VLAPSARFCARAMFDQMLARTNATTRDVIVLGISNAVREASQWHARGARSLTGIDIFNFAPSWNAITARHKAEGKLPLRLLQASIDDLPFPDGSFDVATSEAVLEHVGDLPNCFRETARVLRPGGYALHFIGPLYFAFGGDHCISSYGPAHGFDHILLSESAYREAVNNQSVFDATDDPKCNGWAKSEIFSYLRPDHYLEAARAHFEIVQSCALVSSASVAFRAAQTVQWQQLRDAGFSNADLHIDALVLLLRKA